MTLESCMPIGYNFVVSEGGDDPSSEINELKDDDSTLKIGSELPIIAIIGRTIRVRPLDCNCGGICSLNH